MRVTEKQILGEQGKEVKKKVMKIAKEETEEIWEGTRNEHSKRIKARETE